MNYTEKTRLVDKLCGAGLMALLVEVFYGLTDSAFTVFNYNLQSVKNVIYILGSIILAISVIILIVAYKKERESMAIYGGELLALAITVALLPGTYLSFTAPYNKLNRVFPVLFLVYYIVKAIVIIIRYVPKNKTKSKRR